MVAWLGLNRFRGVRYSFLIGLTWVNAVNVPIHSIRQAWRRTMACSSPFWFGVCAGAIGVALSPVYAQSSVSADGYYCPYGSYVGNGRCSDGTIAVYRGPPPPSAQRQEQVSPVSPGPSERKYVPATGSLLGVWSTMVPGAVWTSPSAFPGWQTLHIRPGALAGLLVIYPNGRYVWNA